MSDINEHQSKGNTNRRGELIALDISRTLNELREQCAENEELFTIKMTLSILSKKVRDEESIGHIETMSKMLDLNHDDPFSKLNDSSKKRLLNLCKYLEDLYCANLIHGDQGDNNDNKETSQGVVVKGDRNVVATGGGVASSVVNINKSR